MRRKHNPGCPCCGGSGPGPPGSGSIPGCACSTIPSPLSVTPGIYCEGVFQACTLQWGPKPAEFNNLPIEAMCFLSVELFYNSLAQAYYRWHLSCNSSSFGIRRVFYPTDDGGPFLDGTFFSWSVGVPGNACSPFLLSNGGIFPGGDPRCTLIIAAI